MTHYKMIYNKLNKIYTNLNAHKIGVRSAHKIKISQNKVV